jgi:hypothetical protein
VALGHVDELARDPGVVVLDQRELAEIVVADIESGPWPFEGRCFDAVVVTNYLWRPLLPAIVACVGPGGWLLPGARACRSPEAAGTRWTT